ncbi:MAG: uracil-DNA glycosylase [Candidatus Heimdallarchaeota archaeon]
MYKSIKNLNLKIEKRCKWYNCCPIKYFVNEGMLEKEWVEEYYLIGNKDCLRYQMEESGEINPDNMLSNGEMRKNLKC